VDGMGNRVELAPETGTATPRATLEVVKGPGAGQRLQPDQDLVIGRSEDGAGALGGDGQLSRRHASVRRLPDERLLIEDLGSTNGTWVNGSRIPAPTLLALGDEVSLGTSVLRVTSDSGPADERGLSPRPRQLALRVVSGWAPGARIVLAGPVVLGNAAAGGDDFGGDPEIAPEHARVTPLPDGRILVEDLGSTSGTLVGGSPIPAPVVLSPGGRFQIGGQTLELLEVALAAERGPSEMAAGGVRPVPQGLFERIAGRAPVTTSEVAETYALALGWALTLNLLIRWIALEAADVPGNLRAVRPIEFALTTVLPVTFNTIGFAKIFQRPDYRSVRRYLAPTFGVPLLAVVINVILKNHSGFASSLTTVAITVVPILVCGPLMLRLRRRVARERLRKVRG
jgi:pSer/pThr/pTyr-binding forkhead associated (FHA) protein